MPLGDNADVKAKFKLLAEQAAVIGAQEGVRAALSRGRFKTHPTAIASAVSAVQPEVADAINATLTDAWLSSLLATLDARWVRVGNVP